MPRHDDPMDLKAYVETPARQKARIEALWAAHDRAELLEARALIADLHAQLDRANAAAVRMAENVCLGGCNSPRALVVE